MMMGPMIRRGCLGLEVGRRRALSSLPLQVKDEIDRANLPSRDSL